MKSISIAKKLGMVVLVGAFASIAMFTNIEFKGPKPANAEPTKCPELTPDIPKGSICVNGKWQVGGPVVAKAGPEQPPVATDPPPMEEGEPECSDDIKCPAGKTCVSGKCETVTAAEPPPAPPKADEDKPAEPTKIADAKKKAGESCKDDKECDENLSCVDGKCACTPVCLSDECGDDGCGGTCECGKGQECNKGKCETPEPLPPVETEDPCESVEFSKGNDRGCEVAAAAYFHGYEKGQVRQYLKTKVLKGGSAKSKAKRLATFNANLLREVREGLWRGASHLYGLKAVKKMTPEELKTALATDATLLEILRASKRMDSRIGAVHQRIERECTGSQPCPAPNSDGDVN